jgi:hypothetical protein
VGNAVMRGARRLKVDGPLQRPLGAGPAPRVIRGEEAGFADILECARYLARISPPSPRSAQVDVAEATTAARGTRR